MLACAYLDSANLDSHVAAKNLAVTAGSIKLNAQVGSKLNLGTSPEQCSN